MPLPKETAARSTSGLLAIAHEPKQGADLVIQTLCVPCCSCRRSAAAYTARTAAARFSHPALADLQHVLTVLSGVILPHPKAICMCGTCKHGPH